MFLQKSQSQLVSFSTRKDKILDLILANEPNLIQAVTVGPKIPTCDHETIEGLITVTKCKPVNLTFRNFNKCNVELCLPELLQINWIKFFSDCLSIHEMWDKFRDLLLAVIDICVPLRTLPSSKTQSCRSKVLCKRAYELHKNRDTSECASNHTVFFWGFGWKSLFLVFSRKAMYFVGLNFSKIEDAYKGYTTSYNRRCRSDDQDTHWRD